jgi:hypothetical protein
MDEEITQPGAEPNVVGESLEEKMARLTGGDEAAVEVPDEQETPEAPEAPEGEDAEPEEVEEEEEDAGKEEQSPNVQKRIDKLTRLRREAEERAAGVEAELTGAKARLAELEEMVSESFAEHALNLGIAPQFLTKTELDVLKQDRELAQQEAYFFENMDETVTDPKTGVEYEPKQIRRWYMDVHAERAKLALKVHAIRSQRMKEMQDALEAGRKVLKGEARVKAPVKPRASTPPKVPVTPASGPGKPPITQPQRRGFDGKALVESGNSRAELVAQMANIVGDD